MTLIPRPEYPRPDFQRDQKWVNLNGPWDFDFDDENRGDRDSWHVKHEFSRQIIVPFPFQAPLSGIEDWTPHDRVWYHRTFVVPEEWADIFVWLNFGAVDYEARVFLNGTYIGSHQGGYLPFQFEISKYLQRNAENDLTIAVYDPTTDPAIPRGKQTRETIQGIFYPRVTGLWQTAWLEATTDVYLTKIECTPQLLQQQAIIAIEYRAPDLGQPAPLNLVIRDNDGQVVCQRDTTTRGGGQEISIDLPNCQLWSPSAPNLYSVTATIADPFEGTPLDEVSTYFGMREFRADNQRIFLNGEDLYLKFFLVQGYWPEGLYAAPSDDAYVNDLLDLQAYGFNGLRMHQKIEDPRFLYHCDRMGVLVWDELANGFASTGHALFHRNLLEMAEMVRRDYNHPCIMTWTFFNESWGAPRLTERGQQNKSVAAYAFMKGLDPTRFANDNDGWEHCRADLDSVHMYVDNYFFNSFPLEREEIDAEDFNNLQMGRVNYVAPFAYDGTPLLITEMGGFGFLLDGEVYGKPVAYGPLCESAEDLEERVIVQMQEWKKRASWVRGIVYTELYDQYSEVNGFLTLSRRRKFDPTRLKALMDEII